LQTNSEKEWLISSAHLWQTTVAMIVKGVGRKSFQKELELARAFFSKALVTEGLSGAGPRLSGKGLRQ
jgi:hypothetical protein